MKMEYIIKLSDNDVRHAFELFPQIKNLLNHHTSLRFYSIYLVKVNLGRLGVYNFSIIKIFCGT